MLKIMEFKHVDMAFAMSEGNPKALAIVLSLMKNLYGMMGLILCDIANIRGMELYTLYTKCCDRNPFIFERTSAMLKTEVFSKEQFRRNIYSDNPIPFIDYDIKIEGVPPFGELFGPAHYKWKKYCDENRKSFSHRLNTKFFEDKPKKYHK